MRYRQRAARLAAALLILALPLSPRAQEENRSVSASEAILERHLREHVHELAAAIGERNMWHFEQLEQAARYIERQLRQSGLEPQHESYEVQGRTCRNIVVEKTGREKPEEIVLLGAHYDSVSGSPGANDNGSGIGALLEIARLLADAQTSRTLRLVAFVNEEPPFFQTDLMGSRVHARRSRQRGDDIVAMLSLETIGYYSDQKGSQEFPSALLRPFYPETGNFIAFVADLGSRRSVDLSVEAFRRHSDFPAGVLIAPRWVAGVEWSDQWSFWQEDYPGIMVTDTAPFRYPHYHQPADTPDKLDYGALARLTAGLADMARDLAGALPEDEAAGRLAD